MLKLIKNLRPFVWSIVIVFALLFAQAMADLSLPSYMSRIINVGIQQSGIENAAPQAIRSSEFSKLALFMTEGEKAQISADYLLLDRQSLTPLDYEKYAKTYPKLADAPLYKLNTDDKTEIAQLDAIFAKYLPVLAAIEREGVSIGQLPPQQLAAIQAAALSQINSVPGSLLKQYSINYISAEYKAIGMNVGGFQTAYMLRIGMLILLLT